MDPYLLLKFLHVACAIIWVGGASIMILLIAVVMARGEDEATMTCVSYVGLLGNKVFAPLGMVTILSGLTLGWLGGWFFEAWTILAPAIVVCTFVAGAVFLGPSAEKSVKTWKAGDLAGAMVYGRKVLRLAMIDIGAQWAIISLMVLKPGWTDPMIAVPALLILAGVAVAMLRRDPAPMEAAA